MYYGSGTVAHTAEPTTPHVLGGQQKNPIPSINAYLLEEQS